MSLYSQRGVSAQKEDVHAATRNLSKGLYPRAFCKIDPDLLGGDADWVNVMHADGAGTKSILAYLYWKETGDLSVWKGIAQDAIVMNLDDLICTGIYDRMLFSSSIDRNKHRVPGEVLTALIEGTQEFLDTMATLGVNIAFLGGETADVGDVVRTVAVNGTMAARWRKSALITNEKIAAGQVIVGLASDGQAGYEQAYNSGIGSNGLTSARHDVLHKHYKTFPETFDDLVPEEVVYIGQHRLTDTLPVEGQLCTVGSLLLSPTRTFAPVVRTMIEEHFDQIHGLIHCSGGGQTKCAKYLPDGVAVVKDNLPAPPEIFRLIQTCSGSDEREMYQVFNMGIRLEVYTSEKAAEALIAIARHYGIAAQVIGRVESSVKKEVVLRTAGTEIRY
ncbi:phosphoribosylformylglycinamidine cyclo-ligase [Flaviaesturariibacter flavus]|uniref:Phosphoribosylformylglycinamidine cyclo-ligase n=1 Tax=Flaviaesturariibacter flavus TaxID=2502780 RepID=A0A4R1BNS0_9BACT|nr:AIR synthase-related protein [Flaviaesturariibacter flavus]TCJ19243.1 phosphoribosylformylglycinamidine cyclo-ligase [Flaviaesturariibacter flavus]